MQSGAAIGGYFELELPQSCRPFHAEKLALNTGRNALSYILQSRKPARIFLPHYLCDAVLQPVQRLGIPYVFYHINEQLEPVDVIDVGANDALLYINYFGLKNTTIKKLALLYPYLIIDNTQAFFAQPVEKAPTFYSARKFFGVPDGAYVSSEFSCDTDLEVDQSSERFLHLLRRLDTGAEAGFAQYQAHEKELANVPLKKMSQATRAILASIDYAEVAHIRRRNYQQLHALLGRHNSAVFVALDEDGVPMAYPFFYRKDEALRAALLRNRVFCARLWPNVLDALVDDIGSVEYQLASRLIPLPIDQRYNEKDMQFIASIVEGTLKNG